MYKSFSGETGFTEISKSLHSAGWKCHDFSIAQILREINYWHSRSAKPAILTHLEALNCDFNEFLQFSEG